MKLNLNHAVGKWTDHRFIMDSGYYSGRPPSSGDLSSKMLEDIYQGIKKEVGPEAATNFVRFVDKLDDMSASSFIVALERFWVAGCEQVAIEQKASDRLQLSGHGRVRDAEAMGCMLAVMSHGNISPEEIRELSQQVKMNFVCDHHSELTSRIPSHIAS